MARFFVRYKLKASNINDIEQDLTTGDLVLLSGELSKLAIKDPWPTSGITWQASSACLNL